MKIGKWEKNEEEREKGEKRGVRAGKNNLLKNMRKYKKERKWELI